MNSKLLEQKTEKQEIQNVNLWRGTKSWWELDERRDFVGSWCCMWSERYGGRSVCKASKVMLASLNRICHSIGSQWSCLISLFEDSGDVQECWYKTTRATACWIRWRRAVCLSGWVLESHLFWGQKVKGQKGQGHESQKQCLCEFWHACECWLFLFLVSRHRCVVTVESINYA